MMGHGDGFIYKKRINVGQIYPFYSLNEYCTPVRSPENAVKIYGTVSYIYRKVK